jgi:glycosyltransferase involved in cell wall biosynthesis
MKVLLLTQVLPYPPDSGPKIKTWNVLKCLAARHEVTLVSFVRGDQSAQAAHLQKTCKAVHTVEMRRGVQHDLAAFARSLVARQPWMMLRDDRPAMRQMVDRLAASENFDIAYADQLNMGQYAARVAGARKVLDTHNALWLLYKRLSETMKPGPQKILLSRDWRLLKTYEGRLCREFDAVTAVSEEDKTALEEALGRKSEMLVLPITVDKDEMPLVERQPGADHILHFGTMYWPPNIDGVRWFLDAIWPLVLAQRPQTTFDLVGSRPPQDLVALGQQDARLRVTGYVEDPLPYLQSAGAFIVPLRAGGGIRVKILEALSRGLPIVTTSLGCEGIAVQHNREALIADTPEAFAAAILRLLADPALGQTLARNGRSLLEARYDVRTICQPLMQMMARIGPTHA